MDNFLHLGLLSVGYFKEVKALHVYAATVRCKRTLTDMILSKYDKNRPNVLMIKLPKMIAVCF